VTVAKDPPPVRAYLSLAAMQNIELEQYYIARGFYPQDEAIMIHGITPEELNDQRGFAFLPSAQYMRYNRVAPPTKVTEYT